MNISPFLRHSPAPAPAWVCLLLIAAGCGPRPARATEADAALTAWLDAQAGIRTWSAGFTQTRTLKALAQPLVTTGRVWFAAPNRFRWELGEPAQTIAVRQAEQVLVIYPRLKRAERYPLAGAASQPMAAALTLFEAGFPRDRADLERRFRIRSLTVRDDQAELRLEPRSSAARRLMPEIRLGFGMRDQRLRMTELRFADGSTLRNDFTGAVLNAAVDDAVFDPVIDTDFQVSEPLRPASR
jgi:outer membrane lipoprotein-sorting protein